MRVIFFPGIYVCVSSIFHIPPTYILMQFQSIRVFFYVRTYVYSIKLSVVVVSTKHEKWWWCTPLVYTTHDTRYMSVFRQKVLFFVCFFSYNNSLIINVYMRLDFSTKKKRNRKIFNEIEKKKYATQWCREYLSVLRFVDVDDDDVLALIHYVCCIHTHIHESWRKRSLHKWSVSYL